MTNYSYSRLVRFGAFCDLFVAAALVIPSIAALLAGIIRALDMQLGFDTVFAPIDATSMYMVNLAGCFVIIWAIARLRSPSFSMGRMDALLRLALVFIQIRAVSDGATPILLGLSLMFATFAFLELRRPTDLIAPHVPAF